MSWHSIHIMYFRGEVQDLCATSGKCVSGYYILNRLSLYGIPIALECRRTKGLLTMKWAVCMVSLGVMLMGVGKLLV